MSGLSARLIAGLEAREHARQRGRVRVVTFDDESFRADFGEGMEPVVVRHGPDDDFGTVNGAQTIAEVQDLLKNWDARMADLGREVNAFSGQWRAADPTAFDDFDRDQAALSIRYNKASSDAKAVISDSSWNPMPASMIPAQGAFDNIMKAIRQCYPPDGCPTSKGDFDDLYNRLSAAKAAASLPPPVMTTIQPTAQDTDLKVFNATAPLDVIAPIVGDTAPKPGSPLAVFAWMYKHRVALTAGAVVVVGGVVVLQFLPLLMLPAKAGKLIAAVSAV